LPRYALALVGIDLTALAVFWLEITYNDVGFASFVCDKRCIWPAIAVACIKQIDGSLGMINPLAAAAFTLGPNLASLIARLRLRRRLRSVAREKNNNANGGDKKQKCQPKDSHVQLPSYFVESADTIIGMTAMLPLSLAAFSASQSISVDAYP
jgi:hypothetical protein